MQWNTVENIHDLTICPWCQNGKNNFVLLTTLTNRKLIYCTCGCTIFQTKSKIWFKVAIG